MILQRFREVAKFFQGYISNMLYVCQLISSVQLFVTPWTVACQASLSMEFSRQEHWSGLPFPSPGDLPDPGSVFQSSHVFFLLC